MRVIGLDVHRSFAVVALLEDGQLRNGGRVALTRDAIVAFGGRRQPDDEVVVEATGNTATIVRLLRPFVRRVVIANPLQGRAIAQAKVKTDKIDAATLAKLHASGFLPEVWMPDDSTEALRRLVTQRAQVVAQMTRAKNRIHGVLHANLIPPYRGEPFSAAGRLWLEAQPLAQDEKLAIRRHLADLDHRAADLAALDRALAGRALEDDRVRRLMTIAGVHVTVALGLLAAIGDIARFASPGKPVSYLGLNPSVRQSGDGPAFHGRISRQGRAHARAMLVERPARCVRSSCASRPGAASRSRRSPPRASWPSSPGTSWPRARMTPGRDPPCSRPSSARWSWRPVSRPPEGGRGGGRMPTTARRCGSASGLGWSRPRELTRASSRTGGRDHQRGARALRTGHAHPRGSGQVRALRSPLLAKRPLRQGGNCTALRKRACRRHPSASGRGGAV